jgi:hypothetical protein
MLAGEILIKKEKEKGEKEKEKSVSTVSNKRMIQYST